MPDLFLLIVQTAYLQPPCKHLQAHYGQKDPAAVAKVKEVYAQLGLAAKFEAYEVESHARLSATIEEQSLLPKQVFTSLLAKIYKRQK
jgi:farnesyl diphosphate synthase